MDKQRGIDLAVLVTSILLFAGTIALCAKGAWKFTAVLSGCSLLGLLLHMLDKAAKGAVGQKINVDYTEPEKPREGAAC